MHRPQWAILIFAVVLAAMDTARAQSLADVAKKLEEERAKNGAAKVYTNKDVAGAREAKIDGAPLVENPDEVPPGKWEMTVSRSPMDDRPIIALTLNSEAPINVWLKTVRPSLILRCKERVLDTYVTTDSPANVEYGGGHTVRLRFDADSPKQENWPQATDHQALFAPEPEVFLSRLRSTDQLTFQFTPFNASPTIISFDTRGLRHHINRLIENCPEATRVRRR